MDNTLTHQTTLQHGYLTTRTGGKRQLGMELETLSDNAACQDQGWEASTTSTSPTPLTPSMFYKVDISLNHLRFYFLTKKNCFNVDERLDMLMHVKGLLKNDKK
jgi:hypothetical protein